ncbi:hypothetical protein O1W69_04140 [Chlamydia sp. 12-01]|uniref:hypothetical protein n=1 Tax=Chlamydia sp. 12-01 TaxID=3002742 RepID=UPI0035D4CEA2
MSLSSTSSTDSLVSRTEVQQKPFLSPQAYERGLRKVKALSALTIIAAALISTAGIAAAIVTGIAGLWAIPVITLVISVLLVLVIYRARPKLSFVPFGESTKGPVTGFANTEPDFKTNLGAELLGQS